MRRGLSSRLDRLWRDYRLRIAEQERLREARQQAGERDRGLAACLRAGLARAGIDPARVPALRRYDQETAALARPEPGLPSGLQSPENDAVAWLYGKLLRTVERHRERPLDLATATPAELFALYCFRPAASGLSGSGGAPGG